MNDDIAEAVSGTIRMGLRLGAFISREGLRSHLGISGSLLSHDRSHPDSFRHLNLTPRLFDSFGELAGNDVLTCPFFDQIAEAAFLIEVDISDATRFCGIIDPTASDPLSTKQKLPFKACCLVAWAITECLITLERTNKTTETLRQERESIHEEISRRWPDNPDAIPFNVIMGEEHYPPGILHLSAQEGLAYLAGEDVAAITSGVKKVWPNCQLVGRELARAVYFNLYLPFVNGVIGFDEPTCPRAPDVLDPTLQVKKMRPNIWQISCFHEA